MTEKCKPSTESQTINYKFFEENQNTDIKDVGICKCFLPNMTDLQIPMNIYIKTLQPQEKDTLIKTLNKPNCGKIEKKVNVTADRAAYMKEYRKKYYNTQSEKFKTKIECPTCHKIITKASLYLHNRNIHKTENN